jgi:hypothetical protein
MIYRNLSTIVALFLFFRLRLRCMMPGKVSDRERLRAWLSPLDSLDDPYQCPCPYPSPATTQNQTDNAPKQANPNT